LNLSDHCCLWQRWVRCQIWPLMKRRLARDTIPLRGLSVSEIELELYVIWIERAARKGGDRLKL